MNAGHLPTWSRCPHVVHRLVLDGALTARVDGGDVVELNRSAAALWQALATPGTAVELAERLSGHFDATAADIAGGIEPVIDELFQRGLLDRVDR